MSWRTVVVASHSKLDLQAGFMVIRSAEGMRRVVLDELDILLLENSAIAITGNLIAELLTRKVRIIFCDRTRNPIGELQPYYGCHDSARRLRRQLAWSHEAQAIVWGRIVQEKISNQARLLGERHCDFSEEQLATYAQEVTPDDPTNCEGKAARTYFTALFGKDFSRNGVSSVNLALNYGYMVLLACFNRALVAQGCVTQLGIFHANIYNAYNLSCDLMEPYRPLIDRYVRTWADSPEAEFGKDVKRGLVALLHEDRTIDGASQTVLNGITLYVRSVLSALDACDETMIRFPMI